MIIEGFNPPSLRQIGHRYERLLNTGNRNNIEMLIILSYPSEFAKQLVKSRGSIEASSYYIKLATGRVGWQCSDTTIAENDRSISEGSDRRGYRFKCIG
jgi:hypothetical protein